MHEVVVERLEGRLADRNEPFAVALADDAHVRALDREVLEVQPDGLADAQPACVQELEEGPCP